MLKLNGVKTQKILVIMLNKWIDLPTTNGLKHCPKNITNLTVELDFGENTHITDKPTAWIWFYTHNKTNANIIRYRVIGLKA